MATDILNLAEQCSLFCSVTNPSHKTGVHNQRQKLDFRRLSSHHSFGKILIFSSGRPWSRRIKLQDSPSIQKFSVCCGPPSVHRTEVCDSRQESGNCSNSGSSHKGDLQAEDSIKCLFADRTGWASKSSPTISRGLAVACRYACKDAAYVNERARNDMVLLSRGITKLNNRAIRDVVMLGLEFLKLDARAREDTEKIDNDMKIKAARLQNMAKIFKDEASSKIKKVADQHWSDGALEADLRQADFVVKRRAMEDAFMALQFVKNVHDIMLNKMSPLRGRIGTSSDKCYSMVEHIMLEKNGKSMEVFTGEFSTDRIAAIQEAYLSMASALSEADGIDYTDPVELELLVTTLIDLDAMDGKSCVSLLAECSNSPDVGTRQALANALATAPSMWTLGNAGMGALQRLAQDSNHAVARAASSAIVELKRQWKIEEGDNWVFTLNRKLEEINSIEDDESDDAQDD